MLQDAFSEKLEFSALEEVSNHFLTKSDVKFLIELGSLFFVLILISLFIKKDFIVRFRTLFLLSTLAYFGFYKGGCPCMIKSMENTLLLVLGETVAWISIIWFLFLIPLTYFFGRIWCGWLCHLGALQEFLFTGSKFKILTTQKSQSVLRGIRLSMLIIFIVQTIITKSYLWGHYDPFKSIYNLHTQNIAGFSLVLILLFTSLLIYRPFCRTMCPVGVVLGWVSLLPGAKRVNKNADCVDCKICSYVCKNRSIIYENKMTLLKSQDCIMCGECLVSCKKGSMCIVNRKLT